MPENTPAPTTTPAPDATPPVTTTPDSGQNPVTPPASTAGLDFIPEAYRESAWAKKYSTPDDFFKGIENLNKLVGQKQIVNGLSVPGADASEEDWNKYYNESGRPESHDKYEYADNLELKVKGTDIVAEKKIFSEIAFRNGLSSKQAQGLFNDYINTMNTNYESMINSQPSLETVLKETFGDDADVNYGLANKASEALGLTDKINEQGKGKDPIVLQLLAEIGKNVGEDNFVKDVTTHNKESLLDEAKRLQASPEYKTSKVVQSRVREIYSKVYPS